MGEIGVKVVVVPVPKVPPETMTSAAAKVVEGSESVKVMVAVCPGPSVVTLEVIVIVGATESMMIAWAMAPARLPLPSASLNWAAATEIRPRVWPAAGVKTAV